MSQPNLCKLIALALAISAAAIPAPINSPDIELARHQLPPTSTSTASPTVPYASDDPNDELFGTTEAIRGTLGANVLGPNNIPLDLQNPDFLAPPTTDEGTVKNIKWPFSLSHNRLQTGGWARQQNLDQLSVATEIAGVNMRLEPGAYREMHWHSIAEWAYMLKGGARISTVTTEGQVYVADVLEGDLWYFPPGIPHSIQALSASDAESSKEGAEFLLIFDSGSFNEDETFLLTDWLAHVPKSVIAKNFGTGIGAFNHIPSKELYIFPSAPPPADINESRVVPNDTPEPFTFALSKVTPTQTAAGSYKVVDSRNFKVSKTIAAAEVTVEVGGIRELHWHPTQPEWTFYLEGSARMTVYAAASTAQTYDFQAGDISYITPSFGHYIENTGNTTLKFLEIMKSDRFEDISLQQWLALTPHEVVKAHLDLSDETIAMLNKKKLVIV